MIKPPAFWTSPTGAHHPAAILLRPLSALYRIAVERKLRTAMPMAAACPVICLGNISMGGVGKTPMADFLCDRLSTMGHRPFILMRGYGGKEPGPMRVKREHQAADVGDEAVMQARRWPVIIARDRDMGAVAAVEQGADIIVMDDGMQNPSLRKDLTLLMIDGKAGLGNGLVFPAGPLRESPNFAMTRADAVIVMGPLAEDVPPDLPIAPETPMIRASIRTVAPDLPVDQPVFAFCGIGRPEKFYEGLRAAGVTLTGTRSFADHHPYTDEDIQALHEAAGNAALVTTAKDLARLKIEQRTGIAVADARLDVYDLPLLDSLLARIGARTDLL
ncbi:tetraacyldisaccharide 4'-kinase [Parvularcula sp. LCG005]|uniref:tetraacyldisaccharide 4'-kinase n=1 Tax=Parvularcula sp. LCG005 TaxID=3078805 RepID=UPI002941DFA8|nr:tetraacyldisaccharide 4'-kinase [Parvularcula sp. LCG005]WOI52060.1 tetraacyldisaccharide 4'-kinase [Parvularcula sp. LCG005]